MVGVTTRDGFGLGLKAAAAFDSHVVGLCADLTESTRMEWFRNAFPERFVQVGVAEENMVGLAAGLALAGKIPFAASYAVFSPGNSWGVMRATVCYSNLNVKIVGGHAGLTTGPDGATHQALEDIALMRVLPNMTVVVPADQEEAYKATLAIAKHIGPCYLRTSRFATPAVTTARSPFVLGQALKLQDGSDATLIACGTMVSNAVQIAEALAKKGISLRVLNMHTIKPLDIHALSAAVHQTKAIISLEEHQVAGGLGSAIAEALSANNLSTRLLMLGVQDRFGESGKPEELLELHGLSVPQLVTQIENWIGKI